MHYKKIVGDKVYLSPLCEEDYKNLTKWTNDYYVAVNYGIINENISEES